MRGSLPPHESVRSGGPPEPYVFKVAIAAWVGTIDTTTSPGCGSNATDARVARHAGYKTVVVTQRITHIRMRCPAAQVCAAMNVGDTASIFVDALDALGSGPVPAPATPPFANFTLDSAPPSPDTIVVSRDSTVARVGTAKVTALKSGTTWVVATRGPLLDSLQIVIH